MKAAPQQDTRRGRTPMAHQRLAPPADSWIFAFYPGGSLCITSRAYDAAADDAAIGRAFAAFAPAATNHLVLCLNVRDCKSRGVRVSRDAGQDPPSVEQLRASLMGAAAVDAVIIITGEYAAIVRQSPTNPIEAKIVRAIGYTLRQLDSADAIAV